MIFIGPFPPPVHGMAAMNKSIYDRLLVGDGVEVKKINTAPGTLNRNLLARLSRIPAVFSGWLKLIRYCTGGRTETVYISCSGGWGQIYDLLMTLTARILKAPIIFHHHSYAFLLEWKWLSALIFKIAGQKTVHVVLCSQMAGDLFDKYGIDNIIFVSNLAAMPTIQGIERKKIFKIGFIGNITTEKGSIHLLDLASEISKRNIPVQVVVGGPCPEPKMEALLVRAHENNLLNWLGPIYNEQKKIFFASVDVLIMPTQYPNEAEPLVIWEALGSGVPVVAYDRGCISSQIKNGAGINVPQNRSFVGETLPLLEQWLANPGQYRTASKNALRVYRNAVAERESSWLKLLTIFKGERANES